MLFERLLRHLLAVLLVVVFSTQSSLADPLKVRIAWSTTPAHLTPLLFKNRSVLHHYGKSYVVEEIRLRGSGPTLTALAAGEVDIAGINFQGFALSVLNARLDTRVVTDMLGDGMNGFSAAQFMVRKGEIRSIEDLRGKHLAINTRGSGSDAALRTMMLRAGMRDRKDYSIVEVRYGAMLAALESKRVDGAFMTVPYLSKARESGKFETLFTLADALGPSQSLIWIAKQSWLDENRDELYDFFEDNLRARRWLLDEANRDEALEILATVSRLPIDSLKTWAFTKDDYYRSPDALPNIEVLQKNIDDLHNLGLLPNSLKIMPEYLDLSFAEEAVRRLQQ